MMPTSLVLLPGMDGTGELFDPLLAVKSPFGRHHLQGLAGEGGGEAEGYVEELGGSGEAGGVGGAGAVLNRGHERRNALLRSPGGSLLTVELTIVPLGSALHPLKNQLTDLKSRKQDDVVQPEVHDFEGDGP